METLIDDMDRTLYLPDGYEDIVRQMLRLGFTLQFDDGEERQVWWNCIKGYWCAQRMKEGLLTYNSECDFEVAIDFETYESAVAWADEFN